MSLKVTYNGPPIVQPSTGFKNLLLNLKASYIALWKPDCYEQKDFERLVLFRNGVSQSI